MKIIGLIILIVLYTIPFVAFTHFVEKEVKELKNEIDYANGRITHAEITLRQRGEQSNDRYKQFTEFAKKMDMKIETDWIGKTTIRELTENEKKIKELQEQIKELECEEK